METILKQKINIDKSSWTVVKFGDVVFEPKETMKNATIEGIEHVIGLEHIDSEDIHLRKSASIEESTTFTKKFKKGDVLFGRRRAYLKKAAQASFDGICSGDITVFRAKNNLCSELLPFIVNNDNFFDFAIKHSAGGLSPRVKFRDLAEYEFLLPPKDQQAKLADLLWAMDEVIEKERDLSEKQESIFLSYSNKIFLNGNGKEYELKNIGQLIMGQSPPGESYNDNINDFPFLQGNAEFGNEFPTNIKFTSSPNKIAPEKSILISVRAPVGDLNIANKDYCIGRGLAALFIDDSFLRDYIFNFLKFSRAELEKRSTGSTFKAINKDTLSSLRLIIPKRDLLLKKVDELNSIIDIKRQLDLKIQASQSLQKSLINQVF